MEAKSLGPHSGKSPGNGRPCKYDDCYGNAIEKLCQIAEALDSEPSDHLPALGDVVLAAEVGRKDKQ
jgi:hypothetical protein